MERKGFKLASNALRLLLIGAAFCIFSGGSSHAATYSCGNASVGHCYAMIGQFAMPK